MRGGKQVLLAEPRSLCAGVRRAIAIIDLALRLAELGYADTSVERVATEDIVFSPPTRLTGVADVP